MPQKWKRDGPIRGIGGKVIDLTNPQGDWITIQGHDDATSEDLARWLLERLYDRERRLEQRKKQDQDAKAP